MHTIVRKYDNVPNPRDAGRRVNDEFLPQISKLPGFVAYNLTDAGSGTMFSTTVFDDKAGADDSTNKAAEWAKQHPGVFPTSPTITVGEVVSYKSK